MINLANQISGPLNDSLLVRVTLPFASRKIQV
jgi:hypothetical protein